MHAFVIKGPLQRRYVPIEYTERGWIPTAGLLSGYAVYIPALPGAFLFYDPVRRRVVRVKCGQALLRVLSFRLLRYGTTCP
jgi:hypothetical protein